MRPIFMGVPYQLEERLPLALLLPLDPFPQLGCLFWPQWERIGLVLLGLAEPGQGGSQGFSLLGRDYRRRGM